MTPDPEDRPLFEDDGLALPPDDSDVEAEVVRVENALRELIPRMPSRIMDNLSPETRGYLRRLVEDERVAREAIRAYEEGRAVLLGVPGPAQEREERPEDLDEDEGDRDPA